jgi:hypothetical protein
MTKPMGIKTLDPVEIEEVAEFQEAEAQLRFFMEQNKKVFDRYEELAGQYNQRRQAADKAVRARGVSCGPWVRFSEMVKINWKALYDYLGADKDKFMAVGGKIKRVTEYTGDNKEVDIRIASGEIPEEDAHVFRKISPRYKSPDPVTLP